MNIQTVATILALNFWVLPLRSGLHNLPRSTENLNKTMDNYEFDVKLQSNCDLGGNHAQFKKNK